MMEVSFLQVRASWKEAILDHAGVEFIAVKDGQLAAKGGVRAEGQLFLVQPTVARLPHR